MRYTCKRCKRELVTRRDEQSWQDLAASKRPVPYIAVLDDSIVCADCVGDADNPGRFEAYRGDRHAIGIALILEAWSNDGREDDYMSAEGWGYCAQFDRYLYMVDSSGFVTFEQHDDVSAACEEFTRLYSQGWGASEDDAYISDEPRGYAVSFAGKYVGTFERLNRARACVSLKMRESGYFPSVWHVGERGSIEEISVW